MSEWGFLTNHARALLCIAQDPGVRLRDIAAALDITERTAFGVVTDLAASGYIEKERDGRRNRYRIRHDLPVREPTARERTVGEVLHLFADVTGADAAARPGTPEKQPAS
jgi:predicted ArsR family transcriptional regulator